MTWEEAGQLCFDSVPLVAKHLPIGYWQGSTEWQGRVQLLFADEQKLKQQVDEAMRRFANQKTLPQPPAGVLNFLICSRLLCACDTANILLVANHGNRLVLDPNQTTDAEILTWLSIETWNEWRWDSFLKLQALRSLGGGDSFHGSPIIPTYSN
jgi:hypothetical protein